LLLVHQGLRKRRGTVRKRGKTTGRVTRKKNVAEGQGGKEKVKTKVNHKSFNQAGKKIQFCV